MFEEDETEDLGGALSPLYAKYAEEEERLRQEEQQRIQSRWQRGKEALMQRRMGPGKTETLAQALLAFGQPTRGGGWAALGNAGGVLAQGLSARKAAEQERAQQLAELDNAKDEGLSALAQKYGAGRLEVLGKLATMRPPEPKVGFNPVTGAMEFMSGPNLGKPVNPAAARAQDAPIKTVTIDGVKYLRTPKGDLEPLKTAPKSAEELAMDAAQKAEAVAEGKLKGETRAKAKAALPGMGEMVKMKLGAIDALIGRYDANGQQISAPHPGFSAVIGMPNLLKGAVTPNMVVPGSPAAGALAYRKQLQGQAFLAAFDTLKGGGAISEKEGQQAKEAIARLDAAQSEEDFTRAALELRQLLQIGYSKLQQLAADDRKPATRYTGGGPKVSAPGARGASKKLPPLDLSKYKTGG